MRLIVNVQRDSTQNMDAVQVVCVNWGSTACRYDVIWIQWALLYLTDGKQSLTVRLLGFMVYGVAH